jgi:hypothetical protein
MSNSGGYSTTRVSAIGGDSKDNNYIWTTEKINQLIDDINSGVKDVRKLGMSPFKDNDINLRRENLPFEYTPEEIEEMSKCKSSLIYFALNYCVIQTNNGRMIVKDAGGLRDFQNQILKAYKDNNLNILMASRQTGKTVTSAIFILWFLLFHPDKTALCVADNFTTTKELIDKFKISLEETVDAIPLIGDSITITKGIDYKGTNWWYNGTSWVLSQQKTVLNQAPRFEIFDNTV